MNGSNNRFLEDQLRAALKEIDPKKLLEITEESKKLGYNSIYEYLEKAHELYLGLSSENRRGTVIILLSHNPTPMKKKDGKICIQLDEQDKILNLKIKGLEYKTNGNGNNYQK